MCPPLGRRPICRRRRRSNAVTRPMAVSPKRPAPTAIGPTSLPGGCGAGGRALATVFDRSAWLGVASPEWWRASGGRDEVVTSGFVGFVCCAGTVRMSEGGWFVLGRCATGVLVLRGREPLLTEPLPPEPSLIEPWLMDPGVPAAGEVTSGAGDVAVGTAAGDGTEGADIDGDGAGTTSGAWVAPGMVSDHPG